MTAREGTHEERWPRSKAPVEVDREGEAHDGEQRVGNGGARGGASEAEPTAARVRGDRGASARGRGRGRVRAGAGAGAHGGARARGQGRERAGAGAGAHRQ